MTVLTYIATALTIAGTAANSLGKRWCFWLWLCSNTFWCVYNVCIESYAQALLYAFNLAMSVVGLWKWRKMHD